MKRRINYYVLCSLYYVLCTLYSDTVCPPPPPPPPLDAGRKQSPATGSRSAGTVRDVIGVERRSQDTLEARASEMCLVCLAVQRRCDAVVHFAPQELRGGAVDWVGTFRYGGAAAAGSRVEREYIYR